MGIEDWEIKYNLLDDYLEPEQKTWEDDDETKSEIYRIVSNPSDSKRSCFYQTMECEMTTPEANEYYEAVKTPDVGNGEVRLVYKEAGSFEDETTPPEISIIPSVRKLHQQEGDQEACRESLLYKTRMWAKTHIEDILENYAIYLEKEDTRMKTRSEYESVGSADVQFSLGSEEDLDVMVFEEDTQYECDRYNSRKYISSYGERSHSYYELRGNVGTQDVFDEVSPVMGPSDYIDTMNELQKIVDTVTEYLAGREEEISKYEEVHTSDNNSKMVDKEKDKGIKSDEVKEETVVEQGITGVKDAMNSLFSSLVGTKSIGETTETTASTTTTTTCSPLPLQTESGISKLLAFIPKSNGSPTPIAVVSPAHQEPRADKKSPLQSLLPLQSSETIHPASVEAAEDPATSPETQGSTASQSESVVDSVLGRLSPFRIFGGKPAGEVTSQPETPNKLHGSTESKEELTDNAKTLSIEQSASQPEQSSYGGSCSGSVELLPETESSGEIPDSIPTEMTLKQEEQKTADDTGFFNPFKKSLTSFITTTPASVSKTTESPPGNSVFSIFKPTEAPKPDDAPATIGDKLKFSLFSSDTSVTPQAPKLESGLLSGLLKLGPGEDATSLKQGVSNTSTKSPLLSRAMLLESVPKGNTDTGWFSNLFKMSPAETPKAQTVAKFPSKPEAVVNIPTVVLASEAVKDSTTVSVVIAEEEQMVQKNFSAAPKSEPDIQSFPESLTDTENEGQCVIKTETQADPSELKDQVQPEEETMSKPQGLIAMLSDGDKTFDSPQDGELLSTLFSSLTSTTTESQAQQGAIQQSTGLMTATENAGTGNKPTGAQQHPVNSESQLSSTSPAGVQQQSQEQKATLPKGFLAGLFSKGSEEDSSSKLKDTTSSHINYENNCIVGKDLLSGIFKSEGNESSRTAVSKDSMPTDTFALPQSSGLLSGLFKLASDTVSPVTPAQQNRKPLLKPATTQVSNQPSPQTATLPSNPGGLLSSIFKMSASEELQEAQAQSNTQTVIKLEAQDCNTQESGILTGFFSKISAKTEDKSHSHIPSGQKPKQHEDHKPVQNRPQIQRAKPIEQEFTQNEVNEMDQRAPLQKSVLVGFSKGSEDNSLPKLKETNEPKASFTVGKGVPSGVFKSETSENSKTTITKELKNGFLDQLLHKPIIEDVSSVTSRGSKTSTQTQEPVTLHPAVKSTQQYLEEVHRLLYGTATEYGYQDLFYLFAEHGIVPPELYEHQCLIEALLWQQLNDYALLEALEAQAQEYHAGLHEEASSNSHVTATQEPEWWNLKNIDPRQFHVPSYPWQNVVNVSFQKQLPQADAEEDLVFDMSIKSRKLCGSCGKTDHISNQASRNQWIEKDSTGTPAKLTHCPSLFDCSIAGTPVQNGTLKSHFDTSKFIKQQTVRKGPIDSKVGAVDLSSFSAISKDTEDDMFFEDSEWYQQWLSLLEQGIWWPAEAGDCGYYVYADESYVYSLLTDRNGKHLYAYATQENRHCLEEIAENISDIMQYKNKPKTTLCGFKIPLINNDEMLWVPCHSQGGASSSPVDLSSAFEKGDRIMNMNLERFSEMLQDSINGPTEDPVDFSLYKLQKIKVGKDEPKGIHPKEQMEASDLTNKVKELYNGGPYWKNQGIKDLNNFGAKTKVVDSSKMAVISNATNNKVSGSKLAPQNVQRKLPDAPVSSKASTNSTRALSAAPKNIVTEPSIVTATSSKMTLLSSQRSNSSLQCSYGSSSSTLFHRPQLEGQPSMSKQSLKTSITDGLQSSTSPILPQAQKLATCHEKRPLPPPQNLLYNKPKQALDSLLRSKPLDFSESVRSKVKCPGRNTTCLLPNLSNDDTIIEDILDFTKNRLNKVRKNPQWTCEADTSEDVGIDLTVEIKEEGKKINMTFPALELNIPVPILREVPLRTVSSPASPKFCPPDSGPSNSICRTDQQSSSSPSIRSKLVRQVSVQRSKVSTTPKTSDRKSISTSPKLCPNCCKDQKATHQGTSSSQPTSLEINKYSTVNLRSQSAQCIHQHSLLNESMKITPTPPQPCCKITAPAKQVRNILDMSSAPVVIPLDKPTAEIQVVPLVRSRRLSVTHISDGSFGVPLLVDPATVQATQIQSQQETGEVPVLKPNAKTLQISPVLCRQQPVYNMNRNLSAHRISQSCQNVSAPANSIKTTLDMCSKPAEETVISSDEAVSLVRRRSRSTSGIVEEFGGISLLIEPLTTKVKPSLRRYHSQDLFTKNTQQIVNMASQIKSVTQHQTTLNSLALNGTVTTTANPLKKATLDMSAYLFSKTTEEKVTSHTEMLPVVGKVKNVLEASEVIVGLSSIMKHPTPGIKPLLKKYQSLETIGQYSSKCAEENKTPSALTPASMVKVSLDMSLKPAGNTSFSEVMPLVKSKPMFNIKGPALGIALSLDRSSKDSSQTKHSGMAKHVKTNSSTDVQALQTFTHVPSMRNTSEQPKKLNTLHIELNKKQWEKQVLFDQTLPRTPSMVLRASHAQLANLPSAPANSIKNTLDMSLRTAIREPDKAAGSVLEMSPGKLMPLVQTSNVISKKVLVGMPLIVKAISAPEKLSQKQLQAEKILGNGHNTAETHLCVQASTYHSERLFYSSLKRNGELQAQSKPMDFSIRVSQCNDLSSMQDGQLMDFTKTKGDILRNKLRHQQRLSTTKQKNHAPIIDLTVAQVEKMQMSEIKDLSMPANSFIPGQYALTSLPTDQTLICTSAQYTFQNLRRQEPYITQSQSTHQTVQPAAPITSTYFRRTTEHLENNLNMAGLQILPEPESVLCVEQKKTTESPLPQAQLTDKNLETIVVSDRPPVLVTNSLRMEQFPPIRSTHSQGSNITRHPLIIPTFMHHDTQVAECNKLLEVSRSIGLVKQPTVEGLRENTIQKWVPVLNSPTYVPEIPHVPNTSKASDLTSVVTFVSGQDVSPMTSHRQEYNNMNKMFTAQSADITPCAIEQTVGQDISQVTVSEASLAQSGSTCNGSSAEPEKKPLSAIHTARKTQISSRQTIPEMENTVVSIKDLISKFDGTTSIASEDNSPQRSEEIQHITGSIYRPVPDKQMTPIPTYPITSANVTSVKRLVSVSIENTSSATPASVVQSSMENIPAEILASFACTAMPFVTACTVKTMANPGYTAPPPLEFLPAVPHSSAAHIPVPTVPHCPVDYFSSATVSSLYSSLPNSGYIAPPPMELPPAVLLTSATHTAGPSVTRPPVTNLPSPGHVATVIRFSPRPGYTASTAMESSVHTVETKAYCPTEPLPLPLHPPSLVNKREPCTFVEPPVCTPVESPACTPVESLRRFGHVVPLPIDPPPASLFQRTEHIAPLPMELSSLVFQNISHTAPPPVVFSNDKQCTSPTPGSVLDRPSSPLLQRQNSGYHQSNISRQVSKAPSIIITEVDVESQEPSSVMLAQPEVPEKESDLLVSKTNSESSLMISDNSTNIMWTKSTSAVTVNNIHITHMTQPIIPNHATNLASKVMSESQHTDSDIFCQKQSTVGAISSEMLFIEEIPCFAVVSPAEVEERTLHFSRLRPRQMLIPHITLKHPEEGCPSNEETMPLRGTGEDACVSVTEVNEDTKQHSILFETSEAAVSVPEEHILHIDENQVDSSTITVPVASTEVLSKNQSTLPPSAVPDEQSGKAIFSLFGGTPCAPSQTQSGSSILGGIFQGAFTSKETTGTSLFSMFGGASHQQAQASSAPQELPGKNLFSMFSGSNVQQPLGSCGPSGLSPRSPSGFDTSKQAMSGAIGTPGHDHRGGPGRGSRGPGPSDSSAVGLSHRRQQSKESPGKGLFSVFNGPSTQQTLAIGASPRPPASGAPDLEGNLPVSSTPKESTGSGLFSMFGGSSAQSFPTHTGNKCSNKESVGKGLFSRFGGTAPSDSEGLLKVSSVFSLGGGSDKQKLSGFGLLSFMDDKKSAEPIPEDETKNMKSSYVKPIESEQNVPNERYEKVNSVSTNTEIKSAHAILNAKHGKIPEGKRTTTSEVTYAQIIEEPEIEIKTVEHPTEGQIQKQEPLETEKPFISDQNHTKEHLDLDTDTGKETGMHSYFVESPKAKKTENSLESEKTVESDETIEDQRPQKLIKPVDYVGHSKTGEIPGTLEESQTRDLVDNKILTEFDEIPEMLEKSWDRKETQHQDESAKGRSKTDKEADRAEESKNYPCDGMLENQPTQVKEQEAAEKQVTDMPTKIVSGPLCAVIIQPEPQSLPEMIRSSDKHKPRMAESPGHLKHEMQGHYRPNMASFQRPPESAAFSGFMSMFSGPSVSSKPATFSFFTSPQHSFFKLQPTGATCTQQQHKPSFFNMPTNLPAGLSTESRKGNLCGLLKTKDVARAEETKSAVENCKLKTEVYEENLFKNFNKPRSSTGKDSTVREPETVASEQEIVKDCEMSDFEPVEEARGGNIEITDMSIKGKESEAHIMNEEFSIATSPIPSDRLFTQEKHLSSPTDKSKFDLSGLSAPPFEGLLSGSAETAKPFSSLFGSSMNRKLPQQPPDSGRLFACLEGFSAGLFLEEKPTLLNEEPMSAPSMFGKKLCFPWQSRAPFQTHSTVVTTHENKNDDEEQETEMLSLESDITESPDSSDTEGPTDTYSDKKRSCDSSPESLIAVKQDMTKPEEEDETKADPSLKEKDRDATDHAMGQLPESPLKREHDRRLVGT